MNITLWQYMNDLMQMSINKDRYWLTLTILHLEARSRSYDISMFGIEKCKQPEMLVSSKATTLKMKYSNIYSKTCAKQPLSISQKDHKLVYKTDYRFMQVKSIAECLKRSILHFF